MHPTVELAAGNLELVEKLFMKCLLKNLDIDLWKTYIRYIKVLSRELIVLRRCRMLYLARKAARRTKLVCPTLWLIVFVRLLRKARTTRKKPSKRCVSPHHCTQLVRRIVCLPHGSGPRTIPTSTESTHH